MMSEESINVQRKPVVIRRGKGLPKSVDPGEDTCGKASDRLELLLDFIRAAAVDKFTGYIKVNYTQGSIGRVEKFEEVLRR